MWADEVEEVTAGDLGDLTALSIEDVRARRDECRRVEDKVSYLRRLVQGRLDIVGAELSRRARGSSPTDLPSLVEELPGILSDRTAPSGPGRLPYSVSPPDDDDLTTELDAVVPATLLVALGDQGTAEVEALARRLGELERRVSDGRRAMFDRIDALQTELTRRYRTGEANVNSVLQ